ncbi:hypothetical protein [Paraburkholderia sp. HP33-1]|uniref:hypothetical protein n=1 Tax=Paraburkholderia sp. HP33-1 TaxID=2883243 RepID=UPI001F481B0A|nr:hypothetical protein [Paraburkholderia sp. HP33-1]
MSFDALLAALQATPRDIDRELRDGRIFSVELAGQLYYPAFFADSNIDRAALGSVSIALGGMPGWTKFDFLVSRRESLGERSALEALAAGAVALVLNCAQRFRAGEAG